MAGNSLGGGIALELARMGVVASATALSPVGFWSPGEARYGRTMLRVTHGLATRLGPQMQRVRAARRAGRQATIGLMYGRPARRDGAEAAEDLVQLARAPGWEATLPMSREYVFRDGEELQVPVTIGWGTRDRLLIPRQAERARALLPRARHVPLPGCGHIPMSDDPEGVAALAARRQRLRRRNSLARAGVHTEETPRGRRRRYSPTAAPCIPAARQGTGVSPRKESTT